MEPRLEKLARLGVEPDALAILEQYGKTLPRDIKLLDEKALAEMKLDAAKLGRLNGRRIATLAAIEDAKRKLEPGEPEAVPAPAPKAAKRKAGTK